MDGWYYKVFDSDFGPVQFDELIFMAKTRKLSRDDEVRFGDNSPWRQAGSIGPLMAHFPFEAAEKVISMSTASHVEESWEISEPELEPNLDDFAISESSVATKWMRYGTTSTESLRQTPSSRRRQFSDDDTQPIPVQRKTTAPVVTAPVVDEPSFSDARWWCMIQDKEYGPVDLPKLIEWASTGRLHRNDYVRFALQPYVLANDLSELFPKLPSQEMRDTNTEIETKTEIRQKSAPKQASKPIEAPQSKTAFVAPIPVEEPAPPASQPEPQPISRPTPTPPSRSPSLSAGGFQGGSMGSSRPTVPIRKVPSKSRMGGDEIGKLLRSPAVLGGGGAVLFVVLMYFALPYLPFMQSADVGRVKEMEAAVREIVKLRSAAEWKSADAKTVTAKYAAVGRKVIGELKGTKDKKSKKVLALATILEELSKVDLAKPSNDESEKKAVAALSNTNAAVTAAKKAVGL